MQASTTDVLMALRVAHGLFRLWILGTALFVLIIAFVSYSDIKKQFRESALQHYLMVPVRCGQARGVVGTDYERNPGFEPNEVDSCWYGMSKFRALYPEYKDLSDQELSRKLYAQHGMPTGDLPNPWETLATQASIALGIPLVVLIFGASLRWAFAGFSAKRT
jgi:hypothetical protein